MLLKNEKPARLVRASAAKDFEVPTYLIFETDYMALSKARAYWQKHYLAKGVTTKLDKLVGAKLRKHGTAIPAQS